MVDVAVGGEEHEVARLERGTVGDLGAVRRLDLRVGHARDLDAGLRVGPLHQAGAVEPGLRRRAAPLVRRAHVLGGLRDRRERLRARAVAARDRPAARRGHVGRELGVADHRRGGGRGPPGRGGGRRGRAAAAGCCGCAFSSWSASRELGLVAAPVLLGRALDVGDPLAELVRVVDRLARDEPLLLDRLGLVEEPLHLQLGLVGVAGVGALVPDPDAHLEEADGVRVAEVEVLQARLDEPGHDRQLRREPALLGLGGHPRGDLLLRRVVAGVGGGARRRRRRRRRPPAARRAGRQRGAPAGCAGTAAAAWAGARASRSPAGTPASPLGSGSRSAAEAADAVALTAGRNALDSLGSNAGSAGTAAAAATGVPGATAANCPGTAPAAPRGRRGDVRGRLPVRRDLLLEAEVQVVLVRRVGEVAGAGDRERRADLVRADVRVQRRDLGRDLTRERAAGADDLAVDRRDVQAAAVEVVGDRAARGELRVVRAHARDRDLVLLAELGQHADHARVDPAGLDVGLAHVVEHDVLVRQQRERLGVRRAARADLRAAELLRVDRRGRGRRRGLPARHRLDGHAGAGRSVAVDADEDDVAARWWCGRRWRPRRRCCPRAP